jgi:hypothetical protein
MALDRLLAAGGSITAMKRSSRTGRVVADIVDAVRRGGRCRVGRGGVESRIGRGGQGCQPTIASLTSST